MSERIAKQSGDTGGFKNPSLGWIVGFLFVVSFPGLFSVVPLRKVHCSVPTYLQTYSNAVLNGQINTNFRINYVYLIV